MKREKKNLNVKLKNGDRMKCEELRTEESGNSVEREEKGF